jgi:riboflavin synthase
MFTGIVEEMGTVRTAEDAREETRHLRIEAALAPGCAIGGSVAVNGACLTVVSHEGRTLGFDLGPETLRRTTLGDLRPGDRVNLERPLRLGGELGGHLVLGHVDGVGTITDVERDTTARVRIALPSADLEPLVIPKGSVAVDGVSLTVAEVGEMAFEVMLIPHTLAVTTLGQAAVGRRVNLEMDVLGKFVQRSLLLGGGLRPPSEPPPRMAPAKPALEQSVRMGSERGTP